jgi:hypothetical protein
MIIETIQKIEEIIAIIAYIGLIAAIIIIIAIGFSAYNIQPVEGDDTEADLGWCLRHFQKYCDKVDIEGTMDQLLNRTREWNRLHNYSIEPQAYEEFKGMNHTDTEDVIPFHVERDGVTFCYPTYQNHKGVREKFIECNYVQMPKQKLEKLRDYLDNWTSQK